MIESGSLPVEDSLPMTEQALLQRLEEIQRKLDEIRAGKATLSVDENGKEYNVEIQRTDKGADRKRARYHSSILDAHLLQPGDDFSNLPETFVVFITENDVIGDGLPLYTIDRHITNTGKAFDDGEHIVYVNGADKDASTELGKLMHDFFCTDPDGLSQEQIAKGEGITLDQVREIAGMKRV